MSAQATMQPPAGAAAPQPRGPLWQKPIPVLGVTGDFGSGKTRFLLSIAPGPDTLIFDTEDSSESYASDIGCKRIDVPKEMLARHPGGYRPIDVFNWWRDVVRTIPPGRFKVIAIDVAEDIETGLSDWVWENPLAFNHTKNQYVKMSGIYFGDVKAYWKPILTDIAARCETFAFAVHQGSVWADNKPTQQKKPKGKSTLMELSALFLQLERPVKADGSRESVPGARVLKTRLSHNVVSEGRLYTTEILPPRLPEATPEAIREYISRPFDPKHAKKAEKAPEVYLSDDQRLELRAQAAASEAETERLRLERMEREASKAERRQREMNNESTHFEQPKETAKETAQVSTQQAPDEPSEPVQTEQVAETQTHDDGGATSATSAEPAGETLQEMLTNASLNGQAQPVQSDPVAPAATTTIAATPAAVAPAAAPPPRPKGVAPLVEDSIHALWDEFCFLKKMDFNANRATWRAAVLDRYHVTKVSELSIANQLELEAKIIEKIRGIHAARGTLSPV